MLFADVRKVLQHLRHEYITLPDQENQKENNCLKVIQVKKHIPQLFIIKI